MMGQPIRSYAGASMFRREIPFEWVVSNFYIVDLDESAIIPIGLNPVYLVVILLGALFRFGWTKRPVR